MFNSKKIVSFILSLAMMLTFFVPQLKAEGIKETGNEKIDYLVKNNLILGDSRGLRLDSNISREEFSTMIVRALGKMDEAEKLKGLQSQFKDLKVTDWSNGFIQVASLEKIIKGYTDGTFKAKNNVSYEEAVKMLTVMVSKEELPIQEGPSWALPYIKKAQELGILDKVEVKDYKNAALRGPIFEMFYNAIMKMNDMALVDYKGIIINNNSSKNLGDGKVELLIFDPKKDSNKPDTVVLNLKDSKIDAESILGRAVIIKADKSGNVKSCELDKDYDYAYGSIEVKNGKLYLNGNENNSFTVVEKIDSSFPVSEMIYNSKAYNSLEDFAKAMKGKAEFAAMTSYKGRVVYIQAYNFEDVLPVSEMNSDGSLQVVRDENNSQVVKLILDKVKNINDKGEFKKLEAKDIKPGDVIYIYDRTKALVSNMRADSNEKPEYIVKKDGSTLKYKNAEYAFSNVNGRKSVISLDGKNYATIDPLKKEDKIDLLIKDGMNVSYDIFGNVQLVSGYVTFNEGFYIVDAKTTNKIRLAGFDGTRKDYEDELDLKIYCKKHCDIKFADLKEGDLVYAFFKKDKLSEIYLLKKFDEYKNEFKPVDVADNEYVINLNPSRGRSETIALDKKTYDILKGAGIYSISPDAVISTVSLADVKAKADLKSKLSAYAYTLKDLKEVKMNANYTFKGNDEDVVVLILRNLEARTEVKNEAVLELKEDYDKTLDKNFVGYDDKNTLKEFKVFKSENMDKFKAGDIVILYLDGSDQVLSAKTLIRQDNSKFTVENVSYDHNNVAVLSLKNDKGTVDKFYLNDKVKVFGGNYQKGSTIQIAQNIYTDIIAIRVIK